MGPVKALERFLSFSPGCNPQFRHEEFHVAYHVEKRAPVEETATSCGRIPQASSKVLKYMRYLDRAVLCRRPG